MTRTSIATDDFNRASLGANWTNVNTGNAGSISIDSSTRAVGQYGVQPTNEIAEAVWAGTGSFTADQYSEVTLINPLANGGAANRQACAVRMSGTGGTRSEYQAVVQQDSATTPTTYIAKVVSGTITILYSAAQAWANADKLSLEAEGTTLRLCRNGVPLGGGFTLTDSSVATGTPGVAATVAAYLDAWEGGNVSAASTGGLPLTGGGLSHSILTQGRLAA